MNNRLHKLFVKAQFLQDQLKENEINIMLLHKKIDEILAFDIYFDYKDVQDFVNENFHLFLLTKGKIIYCGHNVTDEYLQCLIKKEMRGFAFQDEMKEAYESLLEDKNKVGVFKVTSGTTLSDKNYVLDIFTVACSRIGINIYNANLLLNHVKNIYEVYLEYIEKYQDELSNDLAIEKFAREVAKDHIEEYADFFVETVEEIIRSIDRCTIERLANKVFSEYVLD